VITVLSGGNISPVNGSFQISLTIVNVVQILLRVIWIIDNQSATQPIAVLVLEVAVIPVCPLSKQGSELVDTLRHEQKEIPFGPGQ